MTPLYDRVEAVLYDRVEATTGQRPIAQRALAGGCVGEVRRLDFADGTALVTKSGGTDSRLDIEGRMLAYLGEHTELPIPNVILSAPDLLVMDYLPGGEAIDAGAERHAADLLAALHDISADKFGLDFDTLIGGLHQPNRPGGAWLDFFRDQRLIHMADAALQADRLPAAVRRRIDDLAARLDQWIGRDSTPSLIHGDLWNGNVLVASGPQGNRISGLIDPAIYYADAEIELAFSTLFKTFGADFFDRYREHRPLAPGFFEERCDLYNLYPLLVHVRLFGGGYVGAVERTLTRFGV